MKKNKTISGCLAVFVGYVILLFLIDISSKPDNVPVALKPIESIQTYFFGFVFSMGTMGWILGSLLLIAYLAIFYFIGIRFHKILFRK